MMKSVCIVRQNYFPAEAHVRKNVDALVDDGFRVDVVCLREKGANGREAYRGGTVTRLPLTHRRTGRLRYLFEYAAFFLMAFAVLAYRSLRRRYDMVEVYNIPDFLVFAALPAKLAGSRVVLYLFELMPEQVSDEYALRDGHPLLRLLRWLEGLSIRFADRVIVVSGYDRGVIELRSRPRVEPAVVLNVPDESVFAPGAAAGSGADNGTFRVMTHGSLLRRYGIQTLIRSVPLLLEEIPHLEVRIVGEGEYQPALAALAEELGVAQHVRFVGWLPIEDVPDQIAEADIGVVASSVPWLLPNKLFEYVVMGKPVVASASPSLSLLFDEAAVAYFRPDDERDLARRILELRRDPQAAARRRENALRAYENYRWESVKEAYLAVHRDLLDGLPVPAYEAAEDERGQL